MYVNLTRNKEIKNKMKEKKDGCRGGMGGTGHVVCPWGHISGVRG